jgi:hypothetical protein
MKQYLLTVNHVEGDPAPADDEIQRITKDVDAVNADMVSSGAWVFAGGLYPPANTTTVRVRDGEVVTTDGPFAETKEYLGGFWVIKAADLDEALAWAAKATRACAVPVEVRPFHENAED